MSLRSNSHALIQQAKSKSLKAEKPSGQRQSISRKVFKELTEFRRISNNGSSRMKRRNTKIKEILLFHKKTSKKLWKFVENFGEFEILTVSPRISQKP